MYEYKLFCHEKSSDWSGLMWRVFIISIFIHMQIYSSVSPYLDNTVLWNSCFIVISLIIKKIHNVQPESHNPSAYIFCVLWHNIFVSVYADILIYNPLYVLLGKTMSRPKTNWNFILPLGQWYVEWTKKRCCKDSLTGVILFCVKFTAGYTSVHNFPRTWWTF